MRGNLRQLASGSWQLTVYNGKNPDGRKRYLRRTVKGTEEEARLALATFVLEVSRGEVPDDGSLTVAQALATWLRWFRSQCEESTWRTAERVVRVHLVPAFGAMRLDRLRAHHIDTMLAGLTVTRQARKGEPARVEPATPGTKARTYGVLHSALAQAVRWGWIARNPATDATPPSVRSAEITPPEPDVVRGLLAAADDRDAMFATWLRVAVATGARRGEVCGLRWDDVHLEHGQLVIRRAVILGVEDLVVKDTKTRKARTIALDDATVEALRAWRRHVVEEAMGVGERPGPFVFSPDRGRSPYRPDGMTARFADVRDLVPGAATVRLHDLRHFIATQLLAAGVPVNAVAARLGHDPVVLLRRYGHFVPARDREAADIIGRLLARPDGRATGT